MSQDLTGISPYFNIDHNSDYLLEGYVGKESAGAKCFNANDSTPLVNGVGIRFSLYNAIGERLTPLSYTDYNTDGLYDISPANFNAILASSKIKVVSAGSAPANYISKQISSTIIPSQAISGTVDVVAYNHENGPFIWSGVKISKQGKHYYCQSGHTATDTNKPTTTDGLNFWTKDFIHKPSYGSSIDFKYKVAKNILGDGYYELYPLNTNNLSISLNLLFNNRSERETRAFTHFVEDKAGATEFDFSLPHPYNKNHKFICSNFSIEQIHKDAKNLSATFIAENIGTFNWGSIISPLSGYETSSYWDKQWKKDDIFMLTGNAGTAIKPALFYVQRDYSSSPASAVTSNPLSVDLDYSNFSHFRLDNLNYDLAGKLFYWKPNLQTRSSHSAKVATVNFNNQYNQRSSLQKNTNRIDLNLNFEGRGDKEALAINHFLSSCLGYRRFEYLLPEPFEVTAYPQITGTCATPINISGAEELDISIDPPILLNQSVKHLYENQPIVFENTNSKFNKVYLASGVNTNFSNIARDTLKVKSKTYAGPIPADSTFRINPVQARYTCQEWSHTFNFKDNNSISAGFLHFPTIESSTNSITGWDVSTYVSKNVTQINYGTIPTNQSVFRKIYVKNLGTSMIEVTGRVDALDSNKLFLEGGPKITAKIEGGDSFIIKAYAYSSAEQTNHNESITINCGTLEPGSTEGKKITANMTFSNPEDANFQ